MKYKVQKVMVPNKTCKVCGGTGIEQQFVGGIVRARRCRCVQFKNTEVKNGTPNR
jgi:hypothetical protein